VRILIYGLNFFPELTGIGKYTGELAERLAQQGHAVYVVTAPPYYPAWKVAAPYQSWVYRHQRMGHLSVLRCPLWVPRRPSGLKRILHLASFALSSFPIVLAQAVRRRPAIVWTVEPALFCAPAAVLAARLCNARTWLHIQDFEADAAFDLGLVKSRRMQRWVAGVERWLTGRFDCVSTLSDKMVERLLTKGISAPQIFLLPNWVDTAVVSPLDRPSILRSELAIGAQEIVALYAGNMGEKQGLEIVLEAARTLEAEPALRFVMCGQGAAYGRLRKLGEGLKNVLWIPLQPAERLNELLNLADLHLLPQRADAADLVMPSKLTGIFASARPVVATATEGTEVWQVVQGRGLTVEPGNGGAFAAAICSLAKDPARRQALGAAARVYAVEHLDKETVLNRFERELLTLVRSGAGS
jgi:colanic acid biosynthesis glycosyl transferase WcaI